MASEDKDYEQSALGQRVNELMDDGYDFGEAVKQAMSEGLKDGGSVGIEVLFGPKVPAAPSQLVSESDILLGYRGDAAYRSGSEQSKSIGQGNVGSKASFGGGQGTDRSGRSEGASGAQVSQALEAQRLQNIANQNKKNATIDTMKNVYGIVSPFINPGSNLGKVKTIFDTYNLYKKGPFNEKDMTLGMGDNPLPSENLLADATITPTSDTMGLNLMDRKTLKDAGYSNSQIQELQNNPDINTQDVIRDIKGPIFAAADGGRIGYKAGSVDKMRRLILKAIGAGTAGIATAKSGIFSLGKGAGKTVAKEVAQQTTSSMPPPYFFKLAEKIKNMGNDVTATTDRTISKSLKSKDGKSEYLLEQDVSTGDTIIKKINKEGDDMITDVEIMDFKKGEVVIGKDGKAVKTLDEYEEVTEANARIEGDVFNDPYYTDGIEVDEIIKEVDDKVPSIKYASGGLAYMLGE